MLKTKHTLISLAAAFPLSGAVHAASQTDHDKTVTSVQAAEFEGKIVQQQATEQACMRNPSYLY